MISFVPIINYAGLLVEIPSEYDYDYTGFINSAYVQHMLVFINGL